MTIEGLSFRVAVERDQYMGCPWKESDGHGAVSEWTRRDKAPGERILISDRESRRYYDFAATVKTALRDGWGVADPKGKTKGQIAAEAAESDFQRMKAWCNDEWWWVFVRVQLLDVDGHSVQRPECSDSLSGIESDDENYIEEVAREMAETIAARFAGKREVCIPIRKEMAA